MTKADKVLDAFGDRTRRRVFERLRHRTRSVREIADGMDVSRPAVSQHLRVLKEADLVQMRVLGREHVYTAKSDGLARLRAELDAFWGQALANFKLIAENDNEKKDEDLS